MEKFIDAKTKFDTDNKNKNSIDRSLVTVDGKIVNNVKIRNEKKERLEEYYKWQFIFSIIYLGYPKDNIGAEIYFPKGNKSSAPLKIDACLFDSAEWLEQYLLWRTKKDDNSIEWLRKHMIAIIEFKKSSGKDIQTVFTRQVKPELKESESPYCLGFYYDTERLYIFQKRNDTITRYDESKNKKDNSGNVVGLTLELMDGYILIPPFDSLLKRVNTSTSIDRSHRIIDDLDIITGAHGVQIDNSISNILKTLDKVGLKDQRGYVLIIQMLALKIFDEKRSEEYNKFLEFYATEKEIEKFRLMFYIDEKERSYGKLSDKNIQDFIKRMQILYENASSQYINILRNKVINWKDESHIRVISSVVENLQDYSFVRSYKSDLYQLVFFRFSDEFKKAEKGQYLTPLALIEFLVEIVNPRKGESIIDPTVGIGDFLSMSYVNANGSLKDTDIYGADNDEQMIMLAQINMLLNGDGNAILRYKPDLGSITYKFGKTKDNPRELVELDPHQHKNGSWDKWVDETKLLKFDVVLTNPPFGEDRSYEILTQRDKEIIEMYELWDYTKRKKTIDRGLIFLENAYRILKSDGRLGIVLSNSIMSTGTKNKDPKGFMLARKWIFEHMRVVAVFDLPPNIFADTGVNTTVLVAYKPEPKELARLNEQGYKLFTRDIKRIGYEIRTSKRIKRYNPLYKINEQTFEVEQDEYGNPKLDEEFGDVLIDFRDWAKTQEKKLRELFVD
ncbi:SAM-dependent methyltransferase [Candidatus Micrarchaeota archaeon CG10_big_fil_rev_8_21_14_0_10_45_29]|nr:MAG: SAM-dependent methyltransferase [Candidatus Micrarchaeota archaeon CG10_big_fil_rev_8_21_14_0_10_45_29]QBM01543.1 hypothetical protein [uncultured archaeon]